MTGFREDDYEQLGLSEIYGAPENNKIILGL
jgi:hypothetical protein